MERSHRLDIQWYHIFNRRENNCFNFFEVFSMTLSIVQHPNGQEEELFFFVTQIFFCKNDRTFESERILPARCTFVLALSKSSLCGIMKST